MLPIFHRYHLLRRIAFFFPIQLVMVILKKNQVMFLFWVLFSLIVTQNVAARYGVPYLFLNPEYLNRVDFWSFLVVGFSCGGFIMAFNISSYIMNSFRFPFLATVSNPFLKYCLNNSIIPVTFLLIYIVSLYKFQINSQLATHYQVIIRISGFILGVLSFVGTALMYFRTVNKDLYKMFGLKTNEEINEPIKKNTKKKPLHLVKKEARDWYIETYISGMNSLKLARRYDHYKKEMLIKVFKQNHLNASFFEILAVVSLIILGLFKEIPFFEIPAGASIFLLFTMMLMLTSALHTWLRGWSSTVSIAVMVLVNQAYSLPIFNAANKAYGMNYKTEKADFNNYRLEEFNKKTIDYEKDKNYTIEILNRWRLKNTKYSLERKEKPKLILLNTSGGGLRSALWTFCALQHADSLMGGQLMNHIALITGSSGGMVGANYMRELYWLKQQKKINDLYSKKYIDNIAKDLLNPIAFSIATNDLLFRFKKFKDGENTFVSDRAYAFECKLNENTGNVFAKRLGDYHDPERDAIIPMVIFSPTIINDGRKLLISSQPISYLTQNPPSTNITSKPLIECIEFSRFFEKQSPENLRFTTALRMNSTFPYIMPVVNLPSEPALQVIDAGMRDNYGTETALNFLYTFKNWIASNTSGVIILQMRDRHKEFQVEPNEANTIIESLTAPVGSMYGNIFNTQDYTHDQLLKYADSWFDGKIDVIDFQMRNEKPDKISLSWHLTNREKKKVLESIDLPENQAAIERMNMLLK